ncbi:MAG: hypothetical protein J6K38_00155 [Alistipes sp.]|nr:hypothetical protein [Alistipes sp.]
MKRLICIFIALAIVALSSVSTAQSCHVYALPMHGEQEIAVFDKPGGNILFSIADNFDQDYYHDMLITEISGEYAYVEIEIYFDMFSDTPKRTGWVLLSDLCVRPNYNDNPLPLFSYPNYDAEIISLIYNPIWDKYRIIKCYQDWAYIEYDYEGQHYEGWLAPANQCWSPIGPTN